MRRLVPVLLVLPLLAPAAARAEGDLVLNARAGIAKPGGSAQKDVDLADGLEWAFPLQVDFGFRVVPRVAITAYGRYAPTTLASDVKNACDAVDVSCKAPTDIAFGLQAEYKFSDGIKGPWLGVFAGYELIKSESVEVTLSSSSVTKVSSTAKGFEGGVQGGMDFEWGAINLGPYAFLNLGQLSKVDTKVGGSSSSNDIEDKALHTWIGAGLRVAFAF